MFLLRLSRLREKKKAWDALFECAKKNSSNEVKEQKTRCYSTVGGGLEDETDLQLEMMGPVPVIVDVE